LTMPKKKTFEAAIAELEKIVEALEKGELDLEESIERFQEGVELAGACAALLKAAEVRVQKLVKKAEGAFDLVALEGSGEEDVSGERES